jgi:hypothetical protein
MQTQNRLFSVEQQQENTTFSIVAMMTDMDAIADNQTWLKLILF